MDSAVWVSIVTVSGVAGGYATDIWKRLRTDRQEQRKQEQEQRQQAAEVEKAEREAAEAKAEREAAIRATEQATVQTAAEGWFQITQEELARVRAERDAAARELSLARAERDSAKAAQEATKTELGAVMVGLEMVVPVIVGDLRECRQRAKELAARLDPQLGKRERRKDNDDE